MEKTKLHKKRWYYLPEDLYYVEVLNNDGTHELVLKSRRKAMRILRKQKNLYKTKGE